MGDLIDPNVARAMGDLLGEMLQPRAYVGMGAFMFLALLKRVRVRVWIGQHDQDVLATSAPWANTLTAQFEEAPIDIIGCRFSKDDDGLAVLEFPEDPRDVNHWLGGGGEGTDTRHGDGDFVIPTSEKSHEFLRFFRCGANRSF